MKTVADQMPNSVKLANTIDKSCGNVHDSLETIKLVLWCTGQQTVACIGLTKVRLTEGFHKTFIILFWKYSDYRVKRDFTVSILR